LSLHLPVFQGRRRLASFRSIDPPISRAVNKSCHEPPNPSDPPSVYPAKLAAIIELFESLPEEEKRENLVAYSEQSKRQEPKEGEKFDLEDVRKDEECTDTVGVFLRVDAENRAHFRITLGPQVQTLTKAMTSILCKGLEGVTLGDIMELPADFVPRIVGGQLVRIRSQTVYYILTRMKSACKVLLNRQRAAQA
jgi:cysteine desulfuration protein SufE